MPQDRHRARLLALRRFRHRIDAARRPEGATAQCDGLCCFAAANVETVARHAQGRSFIATDNDKPVEQLGGLGTGEFYARRSGVPYLMPPTVGDDLNDMHHREGLFAVQRLICDFLKGVRP
jgi:hypothetical protein